MGKGLELINASMPKTGTKTMHEAFCMLGINVCDAQEAVYRHYDSWEKIANGQEPRKEIRRMFGPNNQWDYQATCDLPMCGMWDVLLDEFPEAKVILVLRDEEKWVSSAEKHLQVERDQFKEMGWFRRYQTIYSFIFNHSAQAMGVYMDWIRPLVIGPESRNYIGVNTDTLRTKYRQHNLYVQSHCPKEQLLIYRLGDGWEPLCKFLNKPVPDKPFPHMNRMGSVIAELADNQDYKNMLHKQLASMAVRLCLIVVGCYKYSTGAFDDCLDQTWKIGLAVILSLFLIKNI